jgi:hypothetical protein
LQKKRVVSHPVWRVKNETRLPPPPILGRHSIEVEIPSSEEISFAEIMLRGALIGEIMAGKPSIEKLQNLVCSLDLLSAGWKVAMLSQSRFLVYGLGMLDVERL